MEHAFSEHVLMGHRHPQSNFVLAVLAGLAAAAVGSVVCMIISLTVGWQDAGFAALGVGLLVGIAIRASGRGSHFIYGVLGVIFTLAACLLGVVAAEIVSAMTSTLDFYDASMHLNMGFLVSSIINQTSPMMAAVYALGAFEAYMLAFTKKD